MAIPQKLLKNIEKLSPGRLNEVADFVEFLCRKEITRGVKSGKKDFVTRKLGLLVKFSRRDIYDETVSP